MNETQSGLSHGQPRVPHLAILTTHPIQYQVPLFRALEGHSGIRATVLYPLLHGAEEAYDREFGFAYKWDVPLLDGYQWVKLENKARTPHVGRFFGTHVPGLAQQLRNMEADAVLIPGWSRRYYLEGIGAARSLRLPVLMRGETRLVPTAPMWKRLVKKAAVAPLVRRMSAVLPIGKASRTFYRWCGVEERRMFDSLYFVDNAYFASARKTKEAEVAERKRKQGIPENAVVFLFVGKLSEKKRPMDLLQAVRRTRKAEGTIADSESRKPEAETQKALPSMHVLMVGEGPLREDCQAFAAKHGLPVTFTGFLNQSAVTDAYALGDCIVLPSNYGETWGLVVNEAMASGLTALVSDRVGCAEDLIQDEIGRASCRERVYTKV